MSSNQYNSEVGAGQGAGTGTGPYDAHDQSTVNSPDAHQEKFEGQPEGQGGTTKTKTGRFNDFGSKPWVTYGLRALQFIFAVTSLGLASTALNKFFEGDSRMRYVVFCGAFTIVYLFIVFLFGFFMKKMLMAGPLLIMEIVLTLLWLAAFIAAVARYAPLSCSTGFFLSNGVFVSTGGAAIGCRCGKAACAFAAFTFLLFLISTVLVSWNVIRELTKAKRQKAIFQYDSHKMDRTGLAFAPDYDPYNVDSTYNNNRNDIEGFQRGHQATDSGATYPTGVEQTGGYYAGPNGANTTTGTVGTNVATSPNVTTGTAAPVSETAATGPTDTVGPATGNVQRAYQSA
jgi:hypothetical protein